MTWHDVWQHLDITRAGICATIIATVVLYLLYSTLLHVIGPRLWTVGSTPTLVLVGVLTAVCARAMLGEFPNLSGALTVIITLLVLESVFGPLGRALRNAVRPGLSRATIVMVDGSPREDALKRRRLERDELLARLRAKGIRHLDDVALAILETRGELTVIRRDESIDPELLAHVANRDVIPHALIGQDGATGASRS